MKGSNLHADTRSHTLRTDSLEVEFRVSPHLLGVSLRHRGHELLRAIDDIAQVARDGDPCGLPLLHPWANRLERPAYQAAGKAVALNMRSPLLHADSHGLPLHGVPWSRLDTVLESADDRTCVIGIDWHTESLHTLFPFAHSLRIEASVLNTTLTVITTLQATGQDHVPVSFGWHPYLGLPDSPREQWRLSMPERTQMQLDDRGIPTGAHHSLAPSTMRLKGVTLDDAFALPGADAVFAIADDARRISVRLSDGYTHAQLYAPADQEFVCIEPMTAPVNALCTGHGLRTVAPDGKLSATFRITVDDLPRAAAAG